MLERRAQASTESMAFMVVVRSPCRHEHRLRAHGDGGFYGPGLEPAGDRVERDAAEHLDGSLVELRQERCRAGRGPEVRFEYDAPHACRLGPWQPLPFWHCLTEQLL